ncbi:hypothetical protein EDC01DRAFT_284730 [Geopyxis carbonaria]|nr:hypothetical protein EDC01DRAFT_284730 [Geopyxis carbonaria]
MPPRIRAHKKVRTGCKTCRKRRVKCDETHPVCRNCTSREVACYWVDPVPNSSSSPIPATSTTTASSSKSTPTSSSTAAPTPAPPGPNDDYAEFLRLFSLPPTPPPPQPGESLDLQSLELLHHYSHSTHATIPGSAYAPEIWRTVVPRVALGSDYCMHAVLAITALHVSATSSSTAAAHAYGMLAARHYHRASVGLRGALLRLAPADARDEATGNALFLTSSLISVYALASTPASSPGGLPAAFAWIPLIRGVHLVLKGCWDAVKHGELGPLLQVKRRRRPCEMVWLGDLPAYLDTLHLAAGGFPDGAELRADPSLVSVYRDAVEKLKEAWEIAMAEESRAFIWPITASERFVGLLMQLRPRALLVLAHYCVFFASLKEMWWVRDRAAEELGTIGGLLEERWRVYLEWPMRRVWGVDGGGGRGRGRIEDVPARGGI